MKIKIKSPENIAAQLSIYNIEQDDIIEMPIEQLQQMEDSICTEIYLNHILDYHINIDTVLIMCIKKVRYNGKIIINGTDLLSIATDLVDGTIDQQHACRLLYNGKQSCLSLEYIRDILLRMGMKIIHSNITERRYSITAQRMQQYVKH